MDYNRILIVDDEAHILELLSFNLNREGYQVVAVKTGEEALKLANEKIFNLIILDIMLPGIDGIQVCKKLKTSGSTSFIPVIILSARGEEYNKIVGLELGADDYICKPFSVGELIARIKAVLRRVNLQDENKKRFDYILIDDISIDINNYVVLKSNEKVDLTLKEFELLKLLILNKGKVLNRNQLLDKVWGYDYYGETRTVDVHIRQIRKKIGDDEKTPGLIQTIRGVGYKFDYKED